MWWMDGLKHPEVGNTEGFAYQQFIPLKPPWIQSNRSLCILHGQVRKMERIDPVEGTSFALFSRS